MADPRAQGEGPRAPAEPASERVTTIGKYRLIAKLGRGGMADVYLAVVEGPAAFNKLVVVKRLRNPTGDDDDHVQMLLDEAKLAAHLNHPNIIHTYEVGEDDGVYFIVMEYLEGQPLSRVSSAVFRGEPGAEVFTRGTFIRVVAEMLSGLHYAHEMQDYDGAPLGIVHRDISPQNIFVTYDGAVKVVDFGIAKAARKAVRTETGIFKGKAAYTAPEQARGLKDIDRRADIFAAGIVLWELVARRRLYGGEYLSALHQVVNEPAPRLSTVAEGVPQELDDLVARALALDPAERFATALEMRRALEGYLRSSGEDVRADDLGARMASLFWARRAHVRQQIKAQLDHLASRDAEIAPRSAPTGDLASSARRRRPLMSLPTLEDSSKSGAPARLLKPDETSSALIPTLAAPSPRRRGYLLGGIALAALLAAGFLGRARLGTSASTAASSPATTGAPASADTTGTVTITSEPGAAMVSWNGRVLGKTPLTVDLPAGPQRLTISRAGFLEATLILTVSPATPLKRALTLQRRHEEDESPEAATSARPSLAAPPEEAARAPLAPRPARGGAKASAPPAAASAEAPPGSGAPAPTATGIQIVNDSAKPAVKVDIIE